MGATERGKERLGSGARGSRGIHKDSGPRRLKIQFKQISVSEGFSCGKYNLCLLFKTRLVFR